MKRVVVTGGSGKIGGWILKELLDHGHEVLNVDLTPAAETRCRTLIADLTDAGQAYGAIGAFTGIDELQPSLRPEPVDALVHFAAIPRILLVPDAEVFRINTVSTYNVIEAASAASASARSSTRRARPPTASSSPTASSTRSTSPSTRSIRPCRWTPTDSRRL